MSRLICRDSLLPAFKSAMVWLVLDSYPIRYQLPLSSHTFIVLLGPLCEAPLLGDNNLKESKENMFKHMITYSVMLSENISKLNLFRRHPQEPVN